MYVNCVIYKASEEKPVKVIQTYYYASYVKDKFIGKDSENGTDIYNMLFKKTNDINIDKDNYFLASRCVRLSDDCVWFDMRIVAEGYFYGWHLCNSIDTEYGPTRGVLPVVSLESNIQTMDKKNMDNLWELK